MSEVTDDIYKTAWKNWRGVEHGSYSNFLAFLTQLSAPVIWDEVNQTHHVHPDIARRIELLCSPHHRTIIKAWYARRNDNGIHNSRHL